MRYPAIKKGCEESDEYDRARGPALCGHRDEHCQCDVHAEQPTEGKLDKTKFWKVLPERIA